jgi:Bacterial PH domain
VFAAIWIGSLVWIMVGEDGESWFVPLIMSLVGALFFVRFFGLAVEVGPEGVVVRNLLRTLRLPWEQIDGFRVQRGLGFGSPLGRTASLLFDTDDALTIDATMRSWAFTGGHRQVQEMVARLQASREEALRT